MTTQSIKLEVLLQLIIDWLRGLLGFTKMVKACFESKLGKKTSTTENEKCSCIMYTKGIISKQNHIGAVFVAKHFYLCCTVCMVSVASMEALRLQSPPSDFEVYYWYHILNHLLAI